MSPGGELISRLDVVGCRLLIEAGEVAQGMIPKVESCIKALENGVNRAHVLDGTTEHALLLEVFTDDGVGTMIVNDLDLAMKG